MTDVVIPDAIKDGDNEYPVTAIGANAFKGTSVVSVTVSDSVTTIGDYAFAYNPAIKNVKLGKNVTTVGERIFENHSDYKGKVILDTLTIPDNIKTFGDYFYGQDYPARSICSAKVTTVIIPDTVVSVSGTITFNPGIKEFKVDEKNENFKSIDGVLYDKDVTKIIRCPKNTELTEYKAPDTVIEVGYAAFNECRALTSISINDAADKIGDYAFSYNPNLKNVKLGRNVTTIGERIFENHSDYKGKVILDTLTIPDNIKTFGDYFYGQDYPARSICSAKVTTVIIPDTVVSVSSTITGNPEIKEFKVDEKSENFKSIDGVLYDKDVTKIIRCPKNTELTEYEAPDTVIEVNSSAFQSCYALTSISINDAADKIGDYAFAYNPNLKNVKLGRNVTTIGERIFENHSDYKGKVILDTLTIPDNIKTFGDYFYGQDYPARSICSAKVTTVIIPDTVVSVSGIITFNPGIKEFKVDEKNELFKSVDGILYDKEQMRIIRCPKNTELTEYEAPDTVIEVGYAAFDGCHALTSISINDEADTIGDYAFAYNPNLKNVKLGKNVTKIGERIFENDSDYKDKVILDTLTIPDNAKTFGDYFYGQDYSARSICSANVKTIIIPDTVVDFNYSLFVLKSSVSKYVVGENNEKWSSDEQGMLYNKVKTELIRCPQSIELEKVTVPDSVTKLCNNAFFGCSKFTDLNLGKNVTGLGSQSLAFVGELKTLTVPDEVQIAGDNIFIYNKADNAKYKKLVIPASVKTVEPFFYNKGSIAEINVAEGNANYVSHSGVLYTADLSELVKCPEAEVFSTYDILTGTKKIDAGAFTNTKILTVLIPSTVTEIGEDAFKGGSLRTVKGVKGSYAETYAAENSYKFEAIEADPEMIINPSAKPTTAPTTAPATTAPTSVPTTAPVTTTKPTTAPTTTPAATAPATTAPATTTPAPTTTPATTTPATTTPATTAPTAVPTTAPSEVPVTPPSDLRGDVDGDGNLSTTDVKNILKAIVGKIKFTEEQNKNADMNGDGVVNSADALLLLRTVVGKTETK